LYSGVFVCGRCKKFFIRREDARRHRRTCQSRFQKDFERLAMSLKDRRTPSQKRRETRILLGLQVYGRQGRPKHLYHVCKYCREDLPSAEKKRDHQRGCASRKKPDMIKPTK
jgi:hypothetical protein